MFLRGIKIINWIQKIRKKRTSNFKIGYEKNTKMENC